MSNACTTVKLKKWGNSQGIQLPQSLLNQVGLNSSEETNLDVTIVGNSIMLTDEGQTSTLDCIVAYLEEVNQSPTFSYEYLRLSKGRVGEIYEFEDKEFYSLMSALSTLGEEGWELVLKENETSYILKKRD